MWIQRGRQRWPAAAKMQPCQLTSLRFLVTLRAFRSASLLRRVYTAIEEMYIISLLCSKDGSSLTRTHLHSPGAHILPS